MHLPALILLVLLAVPKSLWAGAWPREPGTGFAAFSTVSRLETEQNSPETELSLYGEYGLRPRLTLGLDVNEIPDKAGHALLFLRHPLSAPERPHKWAAELGLGASHWRGNWEPMYKATLSYGRSLSNNRGNGWLNIDTIVEFRTQMKSPIYKLDSTIGLPFSPKIKALLQVETAYIPGQSFGYALTPGLLISGSARDWLIGVEHRDADRRTLGLKFALWQSF